MNKSLVTGVVLGAAVITAGGAIAGYQWWGGEPRFAEVLAVEPIMETVRTPREECEDVTVTHTRPVKDQHKVRGPFTGAVGGGGAGSQVGSGGGRKVATAAGGRAGGYAGSRGQGRIQKRNTHTTPERRCETVYDTHERQIGFHVRYR